MEVFYSLHVAKAASLGGRWYVFVLFLWLEVRVGSNSCHEEGLVKLRDSVPSFVPVCHPRMHPGCGSLDLFRARDWR